MIIFEAGAGSTITLVISALMIGFVFYSFIKAKRRMNRPPSENVKILDDRNFDNTIKSGVTLVDFWAEWCGPCKVQGPIVDEVADELGDRANVCKVDVDSNQRIAQQFGIRNIPTLLLFKDGKPVEKFVGVKPRNTLVRAIQTHL